MAWCVDISSNRDPQATGGAGSGAHWLGLEGWGWLGPPPVRAPRLDQVFSVGPALSCLLFLPALCTVYEVCQKKSGFIFLVCLLAAPQKDRRSTVRTFSERLDLFLVASRMPCVWVFVFGWAGMGSILGGAASAAYSYSRPEIKNNTGEKKIKQKYERTGNRPGERDRRAGINFIIINGLFPPPGVRE